MWNNDIHKKIRISHNNTEFVRATAFLCLCVMFLKTTFNQNNQFFSCKTFVHSCIPFGQKTSLNFLLIAKCSL